MSTSFQGWHFRAQSNPGTARMLQPIMRTPAWLILVSVCGPAHADPRATGSDDTLARDHGSAGLAKRTRLRLQHTDEPLLHIDHVPPLTAEAGATTERTTSILELGKGVRLAAEGTWWSAAQRSPLSGLDDLAHGWRAASELSYDVGPVRIGIHAGAGQVDSRFERGNYHFAGASASRTFQISRWMRAWISLGLGFQRWSGAPPPGEANSASLQLSVGTTFR